jgi:hypothetical protein
MISNIGQHSRMMYVTVGIIGHYDNTYNEFTYNDFNYNDNNAYNTQYQVTLLITDFTYNWFYL